MKGERLSAGLLARNQANRPNRVATDMTISERRMESGGDRPRVFGSRAIGADGGCPVASIALPMTRPLFYNFNEYSE